MLRSCKFLVLGLVLCASAFSQDSGTVQCDSEMTAVPAWIAPGRPQVIEQLSCGQMVSIIGKGSFYSPGQYSSRPSEYVEIQLADKVAYVDARYIKFSNTPQALSAGKDEPAAVEKSNPKEEEEKTKWGLVKKDDVKLRDEKLLRPMYANGPRTFTATVSNSSRFPMSNLRLLVRLYDCQGKPAADHANCEIIGETEPVISAPIPAGQTRKVTALMTFEATPPVRGKFDWGYRILGARAE